MSFKEFSEKQQRCLAKLFDGYENGNYRFGGGKFKKVY